MNVLEELGREIGEEQDRSVVIDEDRIGERLRESSKGLGRTRRGARWAVGGVLVAAAAACALLYVGRKSLRAIEFEVEGAAGPGRESAWISAPPDHALPIRFSDGSRIDLQDGARARVTRLERTGAELSVEKGRVAVAVVPRPSNRWRIDLGPFAVEVKGTRFDVEWNPDTERFRLTMHEGKVVVHGCAIGTRSFDAGDTLEVSCRDRRFHISSFGGEEASRDAVPQAARQDGVETPPGEVAKSAKPEGSDEPRGTGAPKWKAMVEAGRYREALALAEASGFETECQRASASDLLSLAGAARLAGDARKARQGYLLLRKRFASEGVAAVAAFNLARVSFELLSDYPTSAQWFRTYLREQPSGSLAREARGRLLEALQRSGDAGGARTAAVDYLERYPAGPHAEFAKRLAR